MALTGYYKTLMRPRTHRPLSMLKYDPVGTFCFSLVYTYGQGKGVRGYWGKELGYGRRCYFLSRSAVGDSGRVAESYTTRYMCGMN
ncbi:hypothetical protein LSUB1_G003666, partial [Lachnellula subtilissima]